MALWCFRNSFSDGAVTAAMTPKRRLYAHSEIGDASEWDGTRVSCPHPPPTRPTGRLGTRVVVVGGGGDTGKIALSCQIAIEGWKDALPPPPPPLSSPSLLRCRLCEIEARSRRNGSGRRRAPHVWRVVQEILASLPPSIAPRRDRR